ncbi:MAG TPA: hypothetical protein VLM37_08745, partial [Fibrobacteraceae bacterium]|nr:hypothetical protein [Fibrobacteraceae bacterium]
TAVSLSQAATFPFTLSSGDTLVAYPLALQVQDNQTASGRKVTIHGTLAVPMQYWVSGTAEKTATTKIYAKLQKNMLGFATYYMDSLSTDGAETDSSSLVMRQSLNDVVAVMVNSRLGSSVVAGRMTGNIYESIQVDATGTATRSISGSGTIVVAGDTANVSFSPNE